MSRIPPEIDQLMWTLAEEGNPNAEAEFLRRYPLYREELLRRRGTVSGLRTGRPMVKPEAKKPIPRFVPREKVAPQRPATRTLVGVGALALGALALGSYTLTSFLSPAPHAPGNAVVTTVAPPSAVNQETPSVQATPHPNFPDTAPAPEPEPRPIPSYERPHSLVVKSAPLSDVLTLLGAETGVKVLAAPGMPNPTVAVEFHDMTAMQMLNDLGQQYAFTAFDQGDGSVVLYPAVDEGSSSGSVRRIGG